jgi:UTP--glucose-1-phosphate uridylyltransferase
VQVKKAVITAAGRGVRQYPASDTVQKAMLPLVDRDGLIKPIIQIIAEEALAAGIEEICVVTAPGDTEKYRMHFQNLNQNLLAAYKDTDWALEQSGRLADLEKRLNFAEQVKPDGYGHAVWSAREFVGNEPFLLLLGDHLYISGEERRCASQVIDLARGENASVSAVQATREHLIYQYGTVFGKRIPGKPNVYQIEDIVEKPNLSLAETRLQVPGLRVGYYLCFFGMHVLTPTIFDILDFNINDNARQNGEIQLTPALLELARSEKYLATETRGRRYDIGVKYGFVEAQIALALAGVDKDKMLSHLNELFLNRELDS